MRMFLTSFLSNGIGKMLQDEQTEPVRGYPKLYEGTARGEVCS